MNFFFYFKYEDHEENKVTDTYVYTLSLTIIFVLTPVKI